MPVEAGRLPWPQAQEFQQALILRRWLVEERLALDDVYLGAREVSEHPFELVGIVAAVPVGVVAVREALVAGIRSEEHTSELQSHVNLVCRLLLEKKKI